MFTFRVHVTRIHTANMAHCTKKWKLIHTKFKKNYVSKRQRKSQGKQCIKLVLRQETVFYEGEKC